MITCNAVVFSQVENPFEVRYQTQQKGGIAYLSNVSVTCNSGFNCANAQAALPITGSGGDNNDFAMSYIDLDNDPDTWMSTSDSLDLSACGEVLWAGLYWASRLSTFTPNYAMRNQLKIRANEGPYEDISADELIDFDGGYFDAYFCFKDVTAYVQPNPANSRYTIANMVTREDNSTWGGWTLVIVYSDALQSMKNLTVFDGLAFINTDDDQVDIDINGFVTPPNGPVSFELGAIAYDGDRNSDGDQLLFNGAGAFVQIEDEMHEVNNVFNSTHARGGEITPHRLPNFNNTLGHDANIFIPDNASGQFLSNSSTEATIRILTGGESIMLQTATAAIDVFEPDLKATVYIEDLNGGIVSPGDVLEFMVVGKNLGSDVSVGTFISDSLDLRVDYVPGSLEMLTGINAGPLTDGVGDDAGEYDAMSHSVTVRVGLGATANQGGDLMNNTTGQDSTAFKFQATLTDDCMILQCNGTLDGIAYIFGAGDISGNSLDNNGLSNLLDGNGCPLGSVNQLVVETGTCPSVEVLQASTSCLGEGIELYVPTFQNNPIAESLAQYAWSGPNGYTSSNPAVEIENASLLDEGVYALELTFEGLECILNTASLTLDVYDPDPSFNPPASQCLENNAFEFLAEGASTSSSVFEWAMSNANPNNVLGGNPSNVSFISPGWNAVELTLQENGCEGTYLDSIWIDEAPFLNPLDISWSLSSGCPPILVHFDDNSDNPALSYAWQFGDGSMSFDADPNHVFGELGIFDVSVVASSISECVSVISADFPGVIETYSGPEAGFLVSPLSVDILDGEVTLSSLASPALTCTYQMADGGFISGHEGVHTFLESGVFQIVQTVVDAAGCSATSLGEVTVNGTLFYAPTAFTPDYDGLNDVWLPQVTGVTEYVLQVFDRWGELVWSTNDPVVPWLGQFQNGGQFVPNGVYHWVVRLEDQSRLPQRYAGSVSMMR
jgi:gliding motility-associated-like protein/uncharacterized repeat protein (TIGR01451 family)